MFGAQAIFHGHAHHGQLEGHTPRGVPVFNVAIAVLRKHLADRKFRVVELEEPAGAEASGEGAWGPH
jgi:hypothetical protein